MKKIFLFLIAICFLVSGVAYAGPVAQKWLAVGTNEAATGPNTWYYACTATPLVEPTWTGDHAQVATIARCSSITTAQSGTLTTYSLKAGESWANHGKIALYDTSGNLLENGCETEHFVDETWMDCTVSNYSLAAGTYYVCDMTGETLNVKNLNTQSEFHQDTLSYASFPYATLTLSEGINNCIAMRLFVQ